MDLHVDEIGLSIRAYNCLMRTLFINDIIEKDEDAKLSLFKDWTYNDFKKIKHCGKTTVNEIVYKMHLHGCDIKGCDIDAVCKEFLSGPNRVSSKHQAIVDLESKIDSFSKKYGYTLTFEILARKIKEMIKTKN